MYPHLRNKHDRVIDGGDAGLLTAQIQRLGGATDSLERLFHGALEGRVVGLQEKGIRVHGPHGHAHGIAGLDGEGGEVGGRRKW